MLTLLTCLVTFSNLVDKVNTCQFVSTIIGVREEAARIRDNYIDLAAKKYKFNLKLGGTLNENEKEWLDKGENIWKNGKIVSFTNSINAFDRLIYGETDNDRVDMFFGAKPSASQLEDAQRMNIELDITPIGKEAFVFFVTEDNPVDDISSEDIKAIYHGDITNWKQLGGKDEEILSFQRPKNSGSQTMMEYFMGDVSLKEPQTYEVVGAMEGVITKVAQFNSEKGAMGYSFRYFVEELKQEKNVKLLSVDGISPSIENIENGTYPLVTNVCLITRKDDSNPYVEKMKEFILSDQGQRIVKETGYSRVN